MTHDLAVQLDGVLIDLTSHLSSRALNLRTNDQKYRVQILYKPKLRRSFEDLLTLKLGMARSSNPHKLAFFARGEPFSQRTMFAKKTTKVDEAEGSTVTMCLAPAIWAVDRGEASNTQVVVKAVMVIDGMPVKASMLSL
jgi:hypothetical protein